MCFVSDMCGVASLCYWVSMYDYIQYWCVLFQICVVWPHCVTGYIPQCGQQEQSTQLHKYIDLPEALFAATPSY